MTTRTGSVAVRLLDTPDGPGVAPTAFGVVPPGGPVRPLAPSSPGTCPACDSRDLGPGDDGEGVCCVGCGHWDREADLDTGEDDADIMARISDGDPADGGRDPGYACCGWRGCAVCLSGGEEEPDPARPAPYRSGFGDVEEDGWPAHSLGWEEFGATPGREELELWGWEAV